MRPLALSQSLYEGKCAILSEEDNLQGLKETLPPTRWAGHAGLEKSVKPGIWGKGYSTGSGWHLYLLPKFSVNEIVFTINKIFGLIQPT